MKDMKINEAVGAFVKRFRAEHDLTLEEIADASRKIGTTWTAATISAIERGGSKADALPTMLILADALTDAYHDKHGTDDCMVSVLDLIKDTERLDITDTLTVHTDSIITIITGDGYATLVDADLADKWNQEFDDRARRSLFVMERRKLDALGYMPEGEEEGIVHMFGEEGAEQFKHWKLVPTAAERRAAKKLGVEPIRVAEAMYLWCGHSLDDEVRKFAGEGASPQKRGRVTRKLVAELKDYMRQVHEFKLSDLDFYEWLKAGEPDDWDTNKYVGSDESIIKD